MQLTVVSVAAQSLSALVQCYDELTERYGGDLFRMSAFYVAQQLPQGKQDEICRAVQEADTALIDLMGASLELIDAVGHALDSCRGNRIVIGYGCREKTRLGRFSMGAGMASKDDPGPDSQGAAGKMAGMRRMAKGMRKILPLPILRDMDNLFLLGDYWQSGTPEDIRSMLYLLLREYHGFRQLPKPVPPTLQNGIFLCDPGSQRTYASLQEYWTDFPPDGGKPTVAFLFYGHNYPNRFFPVIEQVQSAVLPFANILPIGFSNQLDRDMEGLQSLMREGQVRLVLNFMSFRLGAGPMGGDAQLGIRILQECGVPMLCPFFISKQNKTVWDQNQEGISPGDFLISMMLPELDGGIETVPLGVVGEVSHDRRFDLDLTDIIPLDGAVERLVSRMKRWLRLQELSNQEKKVALLCYDYPPGESRFLSAAFLDTLASLDSLLTALRRAGYQVPELSREELVKQLCPEEHANSGRYHWSGNGLLYAPDELAYSRELEAAWGTAPGEIMTEQGQYRIPGIQIGNVFIGVQPARTGASWEGDAHYHDQDLPPHHQYIAYYQWIREVFRADVVVHVGTHGTLEFLPGKANGLTCRCWADRLLEDLPNLYLYYCGNASEAMTAKRRSNAVLISYAPPVFQESGLYGGLTALDSLLTELREAERQAPERMAGLRERLERDAVALDLPTEPEALERELYRTRTSLIPRGLHIFGTGYSQTEAEEYAERVRRQDKSWETSDLIHRTMQTEELSGLLRALEGRYILASPMGDVFRNPGIFPTGRNGYAFDPRFVPSPAAYTRGAEIAKATLERYQREHGAPPEKLAVVLWGLETTRTQGETVGQLLYYLGVRMTWRGTSFLSRLEIIPAAELGRRRLDVTITICGFFRDLFPNLLEDLDRVLRELDELGESPEQSAFAAHTEEIYQSLLAEGRSSKEARELARARIFGPSGGEYGTSLTNLVKSGQWETPEELGSVFTGELGFLYSGQRQGERIPGLLQRHLSQVELLTQVRSDQEYEVTDLDHYYEFFGGLARAVENARGTCAEQYIVDTTGELPLADTLAESAARGIRTRLLNPAWIDGMLAHPFHGGQKIADRFENVLGLAATARAVSSVSFDSLYSVYVADPELCRRMRENNRYAYMELLEKLLESNRRGFWRASEQQLDELTRAYLETEGTVEDALT